MMIILSVPVVIYNNGMDNSNNTNNDGYDNKNYNTHTIVVTISDNITL